MLGRRQLYSKKQFQKAGVTLLVSGGLLISYLTFNDRTKNNSYKAYQKKLKDGIILTGELDFTQNPFIYACNYTLPKIPYIILWIDGKNPYSNDRFLAEGKEGTYIVRLNSTSFSTFVKYQCEELYKEKKRVKVTLKARLQCDKEWEMMELISIEEIKAEYGHRCDL